MSTWLTLTISRSHVPRLSGHASPIVAYIID